MRNFVDFENTEKGSKDALDLLSRNTSLDFLFDDLDDVIDVDDGMRNADTELEEALLQDVSNPSHNVSESASIYINEPVSDNTQSNDTNRIIIEKESIEVIDDNEFDYDEKADSDIEDVIISNSNIREHVDVKIEETVIEEVVEVDEENDFENEDDLVIEGNVSVIEQIAVEEVVESNDEVVVIKNETTTVIESSESNDDDKQAFVHKDETICPMLKIEMCSPEQQSLIPPQSIRLSDGFTSLDIRYDIVKDSRIESTRELLKNMDSDTLISLITNLRLGIITSRIPVGIVTIDQFNTSFYLINKINTNKYVFIKDRNNLIYIYKIDNSFINMNKLFLDDELYINTLLRMYELVIEDSLCFSPFFTDLSVSEKYSKNIIDEIMYDSSTQFASSVTTNIDLFKVFHVIDFDNIQKDIYDIFNDLDEIYDHLEEDNTDLIRSINEVEEDMNDDDDDEYDDYNMTGSENPEPHSNNYTNLLQESLKSIDNDIMNISVRRKNS